MLHLIGIFPCHMYKPCASWQHEQTPEGLLILLDSALNMKTLLQFFFWV